MTAPLRLVTFRRAGVSYGVDVGCVRKVLRAPSLRPVPAAPAFVPGSVRVEGRLEVLVDPAQLLEPAQETEAAGRVILVSFDGHRFGLVADEVGELTEIGVDPPSALPPFLGGARGRVISGVVVRDREEILVLDLARLLQLSELDTLAPSGPAPREDRSG